MKTIFRMIVATALFGLSACVFQVLDTIDHKAADDAERLYERVRSHRQQILDESTDADERALYDACRQVDGLLRTARQIEAIHFNESEQSRAAFGEACTEAPRQRERSVKLLVSNCGCRREPVIDGRAGSEPRENDPDGPEYRRVVDGFASSDADKWTQQTGGKSGDTWFHRKYPVSHMFRTGNEVRTIASIQEGTSFAALVEDGACEPDDGTDLQMCQNLISDIGRQNEALRRCEEKQRNYEAGRSFHSSSMNWSQRDFSRHILDAAELCDDMRSRGLLSDLLFPEYPEYDQEPSLGDYTPGDYDIPLPPAGEDE